MTAAGDYAAVMARRHEIIRASTGLDYDAFARGQLAFDYEALMHAGGYATSDIRSLQLESGVGGTQLLEARNLTGLVRALAPGGKGARIFVKDEAANPSGSFKDRRASVSAFHAHANGYHGVVAATSGNYGAAVAAQAAHYSLKAIVVQEAFDGLGRGQPEILEKGRKCEALGAEVIQTTVGPELFYVLLRTLEETGYYNASLYTPFSVRGIETLGIEIAEQARSIAGREPAAVLVTHAGGGNVTGTARGLRAAGCTDTRIVGVSVDLTGLHMASDHDFNRKSFTTGHTGFAVPFTAWPDRVDLPRNAARPLRYLDQFATVTQGEVFFATEALAQLEGLERGPAGNISLAAALVIAQEYDEDAVVVVSETEYTGAGKSPIAQLEFAASVGIEVRTGHRDDDLPGERIVLPTEADRLRVRDVDLDVVRASYVRRAVESASGVLDAEDVAFLAAETRWSETRVREAVATARV